MKKIAILGAGSISDSHIRAYARLADRARVVALVDLFPDKAAGKVEAHGLDARVFPDLDALIGGCDFDIASVCLPPFEHAPAAVALLRAGKHVLVEKPMATCLAECDAMLEAARATGARLGVVAQNRFKTPMMRLRRVLDSGVAGRILHAQVDSFWWRGGNYYDLWWRGTWAKEGGGCTMNHAVHHIDLFQWMMGMPGQVWASAFNLAHDNSEVEDFSTATLVYPDGRVGQMTASLVHHGEEQRIVLQCERAMLAVPWQVRASAQRENGFPLEAPEVEAEIRAVYDSLADLAVEGHDAQIENFLDAIEGRGPMLVDGDQGRRTLELITAIYQSAHAGASVGLPLAPDAPFYSREGILANARHFHEKTRSVENFADAQITLGRDLGR